MNAEGGGSRSRTSPGFSRLTPREVECLRALRENGEAKLAARAVSISLTTFNEHLAKARKKLGVSRSWEAARLLHVWETEGRPIPPNAATASDPAAQPDPATSGTGASLALLISRLGSWAGPLLVVLAAAALALAAVMVWATAELALRFQDLR